MKKSTKECKKGNVAEGVKYLRLGYTIEGPESDKAIVIEKVSSLVLNHWKLPPADLIISVTGGGKAFKISKVQKVRLLRGLIKAAKSTSMNFRTV